MSVIQSDDEKLLSFFAEPTAEKPREPSVHFTFTIAGDKLDGGFVASCKELPGCFSQGETPQEAFDNLVDAVAAVLRVQRRASRR
jgi:predicted RNase H-like HicB family nuclease